MCWQLGKASTGLKCFPLEEWFKSRVDQFGRSACIYIKDFWLQSGIVFLHLFLQSGIVTPSRPAHCQAATPFSHLHLQRWKWERVRNQLTFICRDGETSIFGINIWLCACKCGIIRFWDFWGLFCAKWIISPCKAQTKSEEKETFFQMRYFYAAITFVLLGLWGWRATMIGGLTGWTWQRRLQWGMTSVSEKLTAHTQAIDLLPELHTRGIDCVFIWFCILFIFIIYIHVSNEHKWGLWYKIIHSIQAVNTWRRAPGVGWCSSTQQ